MNEENKSIVENTAEATFGEKLQEALYKFAPDITDVQHIKLMAAITSLVLEEVIKAHPETLSLEEEPDAWSRGVKGLQKAQRSIITKEKTE